MSAPPKAPFSWAGFGLGLVTAAVIVAGIHVLMPTERQRSVAVVDAESALFDQTLGQIAAMRDRVDAVRFGALDTVRSGGSALAARAIDFGPERRGYSRDGLAVGAANTVLLRQSELRRIVVGSDPDQVGDDLAMDELNDFDAAEIENRSFVEEVAAVAYQRPYARWTTEPSAAKMVERLGKLTTVIIYRIGEGTAPFQDASGFLPGYLPAEAFVFDAGTGDLLGAFAFEATNSGSVEYQYRQNDAVTSIAKSADWYLRENLMENLEIVFWTRLREVMPKAAFAHKVEAIPFTPASLSAARRRAERG